MTVIAVEFGKKNPNWDATENRAKNVTHTVMKGVIAQLYANGIDPRQEDNLTGIVAIERLVGALVTNAYGAHSDFFEAVRFMEELAAQTTKENAKEK